MTKKIEKDTVLEIIDSATSVAYYTDLYDMDLGELSDFRRQVRDLLELIGDTFGFNPFEEEDDYEDEDED